MDSDARVIGQIFGITVNIFVQFTVWRYLIVYYSLSGDKSRYYEKKVAYNFLFIVLGLITYPFLWIAGGLFWPIVVVIVICFIYFAVTFSSKWSNNDNLPDPFKTSKMSPPSPTTMSHPTSNTQPTPSERVFEGVSVQKRSRHNLTSIDTSSERSTNWPAPVDRYKSYVWPRVIFVLLVLVIIVSFLSTYRRNQVQPPIQAREQVTEPIRSTITPESKSSSVVLDTTILVIDTTMSPVLIGSAQYSIQVFRDRYDSNHVMYDNSVENNSVMAPLTIAITPEGGSIPIDIKRFSGEPYEWFYHNFHKARGRSLGAPGKLYLQIERSFGGSGGSGEHYYIDVIDGKINYQHLFNSRETSYIRYGANDKTIIHLLGIWDQEDGGHFAKHKYTISLYKYDGHEFRGAEIGTTKLKYSSLDDEKSVQQILLDMKTMEPLLLEPIDISDYNQ